MEVTRILNVSRIRRLHEFRSISKTKNAKVVMRPYVKGEACGLASVKECRIPIHVVM
jgi:hypothetical protein